MLSHRQLTRTNAELEPRTVQGEGKPKLESHNFDILRQAFS